MWRAPTWIMLACCLTLWLIHGHRLRCWHIIEADEKIAKRVCTHIEILRLDRRELRRAGGLSKWINSHYRYRVREQKTVQVLNCYTISSVWDFGISPISLEECAEASGSRWVSGPVPILQIHSLPHGFFSLTRQLGTSDEKESIKTHVGRKNLVSHIKRHQRAGIARGQVAPRK